MSERATRRQLGRGLAELFGEAEGATTADPAPQRLVPIEKIRPGMLQPRRRFAEAELDALAQSIREKGVLQPLLVRPLAAEEADFELVAGERRWRGGQRVGAHEGPGIIRRTHFANMMRLLSLPPPVRRQLDEGELSAGHARALLAAADPAALAAEVVRRGLNVRATERLRPLRRRSVGAGRP